MSRADWRYWVIEDVKELRPELSVEPLLELEVLEHGEIHVLEAGVPEDVPAHGAKSSIRGMSFAIIPSTPKPSRCETFIAVV
jgi:hypothetical protein